MVELAVPRLSHTGLRIGEAIDLKWSDIDLPGGVIRVRDETFSNLPVSRRRTLKEGESRNIPTLVSTDIASSLNVIRTTFETDRIPIDWLGHLNRFDEVWVISQHNKRAFIRSGVAPEGYQL